MDEEKQTFVGPYRVIMSTCKHCRRKIVQFADEPEEVWRVWRHMEPHPTKKGVEIVGKAPCRRTKAEPEDG